MNLPNYISENWDWLPHSTFNDETVVIVKEVANEDYGYGHHSYEGYGVNQSGDLIWCFSSGCSCNGSCGTEHKFTAKAFTIDWPEEFLAINPDDTDFLAMEVSFADY